MLRRLPVLLTAAFLAAGCGANKRLDRLEEQHREVLREVQELKGMVAGLDKRLAVRATAAAIPGAAPEGTATVTVAALMADPLAYSGRPVQVEAVLAAAVDKERSFFVVMNKPRDPLNNVGVFFDPEHMPSKRDAYLADPGDWVLIEGQLSVDREPNGHRGYSGYALKAKSVKKILK